MMPENNQTAVGAEELAGIWERESKATPGPWEAQERAGTFGIRLCGKYTLVDDVGYTNREDAAFIAHARTDIPRLLAEVERLQRENTELRKRPAAMIAGPAYTVGATPVPGLRVLPADRAGCGKPLHSFGPLLPGQHWHTIVTVGDKAYHGSCVPNQSAL